ncbi:hypothetical protein KIPB_015949, partial [Kipferlia bialata]|eukprot:g15949.t1
MLLDGMEIRQCLSGHLGKALSLDTKTVVDTVMPRMRSLYVARLRQEVNDMMNSPEAVAEHRTLSIH